MTTWRARAQALDGIIRSDRWFTLPGVFAIIVTGVWTGARRAHPLAGHHWILWSLVLFGISGVCFRAFVAPLQKKLLANARAGLAGTWNEAEYQRLSRAWEIWGTDRHALAPHRGVPDGDEAGRDLISFT